MSTTHRFNTSFMVEFIQTTRSQICIHGKYPKERGMRYRMDKILEKNYEK